MSLKLLVANRAEIARRVIRTARAMGIATVVVFSDPDAGEPFVGEADEAVALPGSAAADTYLNGTAILAAARATGAGMLHPGYGFLSENAGFARACEEAGVTFVGPPANVMEAVGSKLGARLLMAEAGVPVLAGHAPGPGEDLTSVGRGVGFPLLVKAVFGGGGRGMRVVRSPAELAEAAASASEEAASAFGDGSIYLERLVEDPRHVEVQVLADSHGTVSHLFERECSIQRRYQKVVEESPSPAVDQDLREQLCEAAVEACRAVGYVGAGTVEFVLDADGRFYFLEVNARLQVEHPVTEAVTGVDIVEEQIRVARGERLADEVTGASLRGHAVEARLYAEEVGEGFRPATGRLERIEIPSPEGVRVDSGYADGSTISPFYDSLLAKVIAWAPSRPEALGVLAGTLARSRIHGVATNKQLLLGVLRDEDFGAGRSDTGLISRRGPTELSSPPDGDLLRRLHAACAALAAQAARRQRARVQAAVPSGWRNVPTSRQREIFEGPGGRVEVEYELNGGEASLWVDGDRLEGVRVRVLTPSSVDIEVAGVRRQVAVSLVGPVAYVDSLLGSSVLEAVDRFPAEGPARAAGSLLAPLPGTVTEIHADAGDEVRVGETLVVIEAMKMHHRIQVVHDGTVVEMKVRVGDQVETGAPLAVVKESGGG